MFDIFYLADKPEFIGACAAWNYGRWGVQKENRSLEGDVKSFKLGAQKDGLPLTIVGVDRKSGHIVGMGSLWAEDSTYWTQETPWIASVFTLYRYRNQGVAKAIIQRLEEEAKRLGFDQIYLTSGSAAGLYPKLGYTALQERQTEENAAGAETLFRKSLSN